MRIALIGSHEGGDDDWYGRGSREDFKAACKELGRLIARHGYELVVLSDKKKSADRHAAKGYAEEWERLEKPEARGIRLVRTVGKEEVPFEDLRSRHHDLVSIDSVTAAKRGSARVRVFAECYATVLIGGAGSTEKTGYALLAAGKRLVPIASFGGAAERVLAEARQAPALGGSPLPVPADELKKGWRAAVEAVGRWLQMRARGPSIVVVHGRDVKARDGVVKVLNELGVSRPVIMGLEKLEGETLPEKWESVASKAEGAIVLATPDDVGGLNRDELQPRARQNVWLELGWLWGRFLDRSRLLFLTRDEIEMPTDTSGWEFQRFERDPVELKDRIETFVESLDRDTAAGGN